MGNWKFAVLETEQLRKTTESHHGGREEGEADLRDVRRVTSGSVD